MEHQCQMMKSKSTIGKLLLGLLYTSITVAILVAVMLVVPAGTSKSPKIILGGKEISVEVADTPALQELGLSGHKPLTQNEGMIFIFNESKQYGFWMKDMLFPIDIIWFDEQYRIVDVWENAEPQSYPTSFAPRTPGRYVLEVSAGYFGKHQLRIGDKFEFR